MAKEGQNSLALHYRYFIPRGSIKVKTGTLRILVIKIYSIKPVVISYLMKTQVVDIHPQRMAQ